MIETFNNDLLDASICMYFVYNLVVILHIKCSWYFFLLKLVVSLILLQLEEGLVRRFYAVSFRDVIGQRSAPPKPIRETLALQTLQTCYRLDSAVIISIKLYEWLTPNISVFLTIMIFIHTSKVTLYFTLIFILVI